MSTNPLIQPVLLFQHHQTTTPYLAGQVPLRSAAAPVQPAETQVDESPGGIRITTTGNVGLGTKPEEEPHGQT